MTTKDMTQLPALGKFRKVPLREVWNDEAASFTPWLALDDNIALLAEALGLSEMEVVRTEHPVGPFSADIVCRLIESQHLVLIENQIERSDHRHLGQVLTYASGLEAVVVVWVTKQFTEEHRSVVDWLNEVTVDDLYFFAVEIEVWQIDGSRPAPRFNIVAQPNEWSRVIRDTAKQAVSTPPDPVLEAFWNRLSEALLARGIPLPVRDTPPRTGFYIFTLDSPRRVYLAAYRDVSRKRIGVYLGLYEAQGTAVYHRLQNVADEIATEMSTKPVWLERKPGSAYQIGVALEQTDPLDEADWDRQIEWFCEWLEKFRQIFQPRIAEMPEASELKEEVEALSVGVPASGA